MGVVELFHYFVESGYIFSSLSRRAQCESRTLVFDNTLKPIWEDLDYTLRSRTLVFDNTLKPWNGSSWDALDRELSYLTTLSNVVSTLTAETTDRELSYLTTLSNTACGCRQRGSGLRTLVFDNTLKHSCTTKMTISRSRTLVFDNTLKQPHPHHQPLR